MTKQPERTPRGAREDQRSSKPPRQSQGKRQGRSSSKGRRRGPGKGNQPVAEGHAEVTIKGSARPLSEEVDNVEIVKYGHEDGQEVSRPLTLERYDFPDPNPEPDSYGDDLFRNLTGGYRPGSGKSTVQIQTLIRWGIPPKSTWFPRNETLYQTGQRLLVETEKGIFVGTVLAPSVLSSEQGQNSPRRVLRPLSDKDEERIGRHETLAREAFTYARSRIDHHKLDMNLFNVHVLHNGDKILFYFTSENRIDFRQLVRELAARFSMRIEMRQMGVRDDAKILGGIGPCGRMLCCSNHLNRFIPVSIRMAKDQNLVLKPQNVSGQCGRLKCCLAYEEEFYKELRKDLPKNGKRIETPGGMGRVLEVNILQGTVRVELEPGEIAVFTKEELKAPRDRAAAPREPATDENTTVRNLPDGAPDESPRPEENAETSGNVATQQAPRSQQRPPREGRGEGSRPPQSSERGERRRGGRGRGGSDRRGPRGEGQSPRGEGQSPRGEGQSPRGEGQSPRGEGQSPRGEGRGGSQGEGGRERGQGRRSRSPRRDQDGQGRRRSADGGQRSQGGGRRGPRGGEGRPGPSGGEGKPGPSGGGGKPGPSGGQDS